MELNGQLHAPAALPLGKEPVPVLRRDEWALEPVWAEWLSFCVLIKMGCEGRKLTELAA